MEEAKIDKELVGIHLLDVGKRFNFTWIFRHVDLKLQKGSHIAILGANGSGKSTLMQCIAGFQPVSEGQRIIKQGNKEIDSALFYQQISIAAPYQDLIDDFTFCEMLEFHFKLKKIRNHHTIADLISFSELVHVKDKKLLYFSSGMRQRVKILMAVMSDADFLFLDEPCSNLDAKSIDWFRKLIQQNAHERAILVCSNHQTFEYDFCDHIFELHHQSLHKR